MVTDLRQALQDVADDAPARDLDLASVLGEGTRRVRRRRVRVVGGAALTAAVVTVAVALPQLAERSERPEPAAPVVLDPDAARKVEPDVLLSRRTTWREPMNELDHDKFLGLTDDGLALRSRYTYEGDVDELGLTDPDTGETSWLPRPPGDLGEPAPLELGADRLVLLDNRHAYRRTVLTFDRLGREWTRVQYRLRGIEHMGHMSGPAAWLADGQLYLVDLEDYSWWTAPAAGGLAEHQPDLDGLALAWRGERRAAGGPGGTVEVIDGAGEPVLRLRSPEGCDLSVGPPGWRELPATMPRALVDFAGARPVVTYVCGQGLWTVVYEPDGRPFVAVEPGPVRVTSAGERYVMLAVWGVESNDEASSTYLLDLDTRELLQIDRGPHEASADVVGDLVLWNTAGPIDDRDVYDVVWRVARFG